MTSDPGVSAVPAGLIRASCRIWCDESIILSESVAVEPTDLVKRLSV